MVIFFGIWVLTIITLASIGMLIFSEIKAFDNLEDASLVIFNTALGSFNFGMFDELEEQRKDIGYLYYIIVLCSNLLILVNLLIAIMSDTYAKFV